MLAAGVFGYGYYQVLSFDTETLPAHHGQVRTELFLGEGDRQTSDPETAEHPRYEVFELSLQCAQHGVPP